MELIRSIGVSGNFEQILNEIETDMGLILYGTDGHASIVGENVTFNFVVDLTAEEITTFDGIISAHIGDPDWEYPCHRICDDCDSRIAEKPIYTINYKSEIEPGVTYTPVYIIENVGKNAGLLQKTEYYKDFVDSNNKGTIILHVEEAYVTDESEPSYEHTRKPVLSRTKTWKYYMDDGSIDESVTKTKTKLYDTRTKRHKEGERRRNNVIEQYVDNIGLAGILSGTFTSEEDAHHKLTYLQEEHAAAFIAWTNSGLGTLYTDIASDTSNTWLDDTIVDSPTTQAMCPWMIGMSFRIYTVEKLKGNIQ